MTHGAQSPRAIAKAVIEGFVGGIMAKVVLKSTDLHLTKRNLSFDSCTADERIDALLSHSQLFVADPSTRSRLSLALRKALQSEGSGPPAQKPRALARANFASDPPGFGDSTPASRQKSSELRIESDADIMEARRLCKEFCGELGFSPLDRVKVCTVVSELARNIQLYVGVGTVTISTIGSPRAGIEILARDHGPGITNLDRVMRGDHDSKTGMGRGLMGSKAIMDEFELDTGPATGTRIRARKYVDARP